MVWCEFSTSLSAGRYIILEAVGISKCTEPLTRASKYGDFQLIFSFSCGLIRRIRVMDRVDMALLHYHKQGIVI